ncbi:MAG TPA: hypothetical protein VFV48_03045 [Pseudomonadales bacterium]|nr:hypothetical protein [Pseudomonadales bacterium]
MSKITTVSATFVLSALLCVFSSPLNAGEATLAQGRPVAQQKKPEWWFSGVGKNVPLCHDFLRAIKARKCEDYGCAYEAMIHSKNFVEPPWEDLDPNQHVGLLANLQTIGQIGARRYWALAPAERDPNSLDNVTRGKYFVSQGQKIRVWRARLFERYGYQPDPARPGNQTIVELRYPASNGGFNDFTYLVSTDLKEPDPQADDGTVAALSSSKLFLLDGVPYFFGSSYVGHIKSGALETLCSIDYLN